MPEELVDGSGAYVLLLAHGAGAPMDSSYMAMLADSLAKHDVKVVRFEFEYMRRRREDGKKRPPPKAEELLGEFRQKIEEFDEAEHLFVGGKSMGGRMASLIAASQSPIAGCVCFGYPFHPPANLIVGEQTISRIFQCLS